MSAQTLDLCLAATLVIATGTMMAWRSVRSGLVLFLLYSTQSACLAWASHSLDGVAWGGAARAGFLIAVVGVLAHRLATYARPRPPAPRDRLLVPLVHIAQAWMFLELLAWPARALLLPPSPSLDAWTLGAPLLLAAALLPWTHRRPRTFRVRVPVRALTRPLRVVHLSDLHLGPYTTEVRLRWLAETVSGERGDVIAMTGDFLTLRTQQDWSPLLAFVDRLRAAEGVYACLGNHDVHVADGLTNSLRARGVTVLRDEVAWLEPRDGHPPVAIAGIDWRAGHGARQAYSNAFAALCNTAGPDGPPILLCHEPSAFRLAPPAFGGLMLAGHLHGGQVGVTWGHRGVSILRLFGMYDQGLFGRGHAQLYSHRGTGVYGFPLRIGVPSEIAVLDLVPAGESIPG